MSSPDKRERRKHKSSDKHGGEEDRHKHRSAKARGERSGGVRATGDGVEERSRRPRGVSSADMMEPRTSSPARTKDNVSTSRAQSPAPQAASDAQQLNATQFAGAQAPRQPDPLAAAFASRLLRLRDVQRALAARRLALIGEVRRRCT